MLLINNLSFSRNETKIFENLNLSLSNKKIIQIKGNNGSGKTTFLKVILNILEPNNGEIIWKGKNIKKNIFDFYNQTTFIMDNNTSTRELSVEDNINFWRGLSSSKLNNEEIFELLNKLNIEKYYKTKVMYLSSGERKKLELIRLILEQKKLWILDEPFNHLDDLSIKILNQTFLDHVNSGGMILFASHYDPMINNLETLVLN
ncbi:heme ABC exporter ATP-binding protein CcmA [Alphaproteobacteria bacterium]|nr:heme ABC exporter ATP-binding protein CcmA [Alphaproteobacteria bacterium]MDC3269808.1 heme ABC exporter ATP-binding protein CcmA [Alphaproteobacteria bacterium]